MDWDEEDWVAENEFAADICFIETCEPDICMPVNCEESTWTPDSWPKLIWVPVIALDEVIVWPEVREELWTNDVGDEMDLDSDLDVRVLKHIFIRHHGALCLTNCTDKRQAQLSFSVAFYMRKLFFLIFKRTFLATWGQRIPGSGLG